ncbi:ABC transporter ATP-binding protein [Devosia rhodophyticola]|uniref:ABC transporter ATP-binding protein n=1 Tax=Devosia rhodophyticola TaxID=3026423 RepID=UPI0038990EAF
MAQGPILDLAQVEVRFPSARGTFAVVDRVDLSVAHGEVLGLVGESGCGKSMLARSIMGLVPPPGVTTGGTMLFNGVDMVGLSKDERRRLRGDRIAVVPQEPMTSLNPTLRIGDQLTEVLRAHRPTMSSDERRARALVVMEQVGIQFAEQRLSQYPHELSGGIRQRVMIAMALICGGVELLIADEPTTALDVTIQAQILELFMQLQSEQKMAVILITHDLAVIAQTAHRVAVMYAGNIVELAPVLDLFDVPRHPYTRGLLESMPRRGISASKTHLATISGSVPDPSNPPAGCRFFDRCQFAVKGTCDAENPALEQITEDRWVRCFRWRELPEFVLADAGAGS